MIRHKFPISFQHDSMQCGIACLQMICKYFGREYSLHSLSRICFATNEGVSLLGISDAAETLGLRTVSARISVSDLGKAQLPAILHWNQNHFVVLYKVKTRKDIWKNEYLIADPGKGRVCYHLRE